MAQVRSQSVSSSGSGSSYSSYYSYSGSCEMQQTTAVPPGQLEPSGQPVGPPEAVRSQDEVDECDGRTALGFEVRDLLKVSSDRQIAIDESALAVGQTRRLVKDTKEDLMQVTAQTRVADRSGLHQSMFAESYHRCECCPGPVASPLGSGILRAANLPDYEYVAAHDPVKNPTGGPRHNRPAQALAAASPVVWAPSATAQLSKPPPPVKRNRSKKKKGRGSSSGCQEEPPATRRKPRRAGWSLVPREASESCEDNADAGGSDGFAQQSVVWGLLVPPWRAAEHAVPKPPPPVPAPVPRLVPAARDSHPPKAGNGQCGGVRDGPALSV
eukprot:5460771-Amphidinium_carterae.1